MLLKEAIADSTNGEYVKFVTVGDSVTGTIMSTEMEHVVDFDTKVPKYWDVEKTRPTMQAKIKLQTHEEEELRIRTAYVKRWGDCWKNLCKSVTSIGEEDLEIGGTLTITFSHEKINKEKPHHSPEKILIFQYTPPKAKGIIAQSQTQQPPAQYNQQPSAQYNQQPQMQAVPPQQTHMQAVPPIQQTYTGGVPADAPTPESMQQPAMINTAQQLEQAKGLLATGLVDIQTIANTTNLDITVIQAMQNAA